MLKDGCQQKQSESIYRAGESRKQARAVLEPNKQTNLNSPARPLCKPAGRFRNSGRFWVDGKERRNVSCKLYTNSLLKTFSAGKPPGLLCTPPATLRQTMLFAHEKRNCLKCLFEFPS